MAQPRFDVVELQHGPVNLGNQPLHQQPLHLGSQLFVPKQGYFQSESFFIGANVLLMAVGSEQKVRSFQKLLVSYSLNAYRLRVAKASLHQSSTLSALSIMRPSLKMYLQRYQMLRLKMMRLLLRGLLEGSRESASFLKGLSHQSIEPSTSKALHCLIFSRSSRTGTQDTREQMLYLAISNCSPAVSRLSSINICSLTSTFSRGSHSPFEIQFKRCSNFVNPYLIVAMSTSSLTLQMFLSIFGSTSANSATCVSFTIPLTSSLTSCLKKSSISACKRLLHWPVIFQKSQTTLLAQLMLLIKGLRAILKQLSLLLLRFCLKAAATLRLRRKGSKLPPMIFSVMLRVRLSFTSFSTASSSSPTSSSLTWLTILASLSICFNSTTVRSKSPSNFICRSSSSILPEIRSSLIFSIFTRSQRHPKSFSFLRLSSSARLSLSTSLASLFSASQLTSSLLLRSLAPWRAPDSFCSTALLQAQNLLSSLRKASHCWEQWSSMLDMISSAERGKVLGTSMQSRILRSISSSSIFITLNPNKILILNPKTTHKSLLLVQLIDQGHCLADCRKKCLDILQISLWHL